jgi:hypothetical protein
MATHTPNIILKSLLKQEANSSRVSVPHSLSHSGEKIRRANDAWCIVTTDGSTRIIGCKNEIESIESGTQNQVIDDVCEESLPISNEDLTDETEPGVDLSYLDVEKDVEKATVSKLIAGMHALTKDEPANASRHEIAMPSAKTDLHEILKTDKVCMVNSPKTEAAGFRVQSSECSQTQSSIS